MIKSSFKLQELRSLGCSRDEISAITFRIYLDLSDAKHYHEVNYYFLPELDYLYLKLKKTKDDEEKIVIPMSSGLTTCFNEIEKFQNYFKTNSICLAICDPSSVIMYYDLTKS